MGALLGAQPFTQPGVDLLLLDPVVERLGHAAYLGGNRFNAGPQGGILAPVLLNHSNGAFAHFREKRLDFLLFMAPSSQSKAPPRLPGRFSTSDNEYFHYLSLAEIQRFVIMVLDELMTYCLLNGSH